jgi:hypothetical protein
VEALDLTDDDRILAVRERGMSRQRISLLDVEELTAGVVRISPPAGNC